MREAAELRRRYNPNLRAFSAVGYREAFSVLDGSSSVPEAIERISTRTRQFARRQRTWFRSEPDITWLDATAEVPMAAARPLVERFLGS